MDLSQTSAKQLVEFLERLADRTRLPFSTVLSDLMLADAVAEIARRLHEHERLKVDVLPDRVNRVAELEEALRAVEWSGQKLYAAYGPLMPCCPACAGIRPDYMPLGPEHLGHTHGHAADCPLAKALGKDGAG